MAKYNGTIELISGITQANDQDFPLVDASAVQVDDTGKRLDEALEELSNGGAGGSNLEIDATLTQSGMAADAKVTGDEIYALKQKRFECLTEDEYNALKASDQLDPNIPYLIIEG